MRTSYTVTVTSVDEGREGIPPSLYGIDSNDPRGQLVDRSGLAPAEVREIDELMAALGRLRDAEQELSDASLRYMKLNRSDMRALHYLIVAGNQGMITTPGGISAHLKISSASTTKLLDRLERAGHVTRQPHPTDRRALAISITPQTRQAAMNTVGLQQAKRFHAAARLTSPERETVTRFLDDMTGELGFDESAWGRTPPDSER